MPIFVKVIIIIATVTVVGGTTAAIIKNIQDKRDSNSTNTEQIAENTNINESEEETNTNESEEKGVNENTNTEKIKEKEPTNTNESESETEEEEEETNENTNSVPTVKNTNEDEEITEPDEEETKGNCANVDPSGTWNISVSEDGASFAPGKVSKTFNFTESGTGNAVETYKDEDAQFTAYHSGNWTKNGCTISYRGIATGTGTHYESGGFNLKFDVQMDGIISEDGRYFTGSWTSKEVYYNSVISATDYVTGSMKALK